MRADPLAIATAAFVFSPAALDVTKPGWRFWLDNQDQFRRVWSPVPEVATQLQIRWDQMFAHLMREIRPEWDQAQVEAIVVEYWPDNTYERLLADAKLAILAITRLPGWEVVSKRG